MIPNIPNIEHPERFTDFTLPKEKVEYAIAEAKKKVDFALPSFIDRFPDHASVRNVYKPVENNGGWNEGFWSGILLHMYELTGEEKYKDAVLRQIPTYTRRIKEKLGICTHDMGFVYSLSCVAAWKLFGNAEAREDAILAADNLMSRYHEKGKFLQAWGKVDDPASYRLIVDCLLNIPLLYWAAETTGNRHYRDIAYQHFKTTAEVCCRADASTYHTYYFDVNTGAPLRGVTAQGANDESAWSRGQSWGIYGPMLTYVYEKDPKAMQVFCATTNYFLNHLPADYIPFWDLSFTDGDDEPRDSSAAAIAVCGMLEALKHLDRDDPRFALYRNASARIMNSLIDHYLTKDIPESNGLLLHATYSKPHNNGVDEMNIWGDYFYMEALHRLVNPDWNLYW